MSFYIIERLGAHYLILVANLAIFLCYFCSARHFMCAHWNQYWTFFVSSRPLNLDF